jgi:hypothetical protein
MMPRTTEAADGRCRAGVVVGLVHPRRDDEGEDVEDHNREPGTAQGAAPQRRAAAAPPARRLTVRATMGANGKTGQLYCHGRRISWSVDGGDIIGSIQEDQSSSSSSWEDLLNRTVTVASEGHHYSILLRTHGPCLYCAEPLSDARNVRLLYMSVAGPR